MSSKLPYFKFDADDWLTGKIQLLPMEQQGIYVSLLARIWRENGRIQNMPNLYLQFRVTQGTLRDALATLKELGILQENDGFLSVKFLTRQLDERAEYIERQREFGRQKGKTKRVPPGNRREDNRINDNNKEKKYKKEICEFVEKVKKHYPNLGGVYKAQRIILNAIDREFDKGMEIPQILEMMLNAVITYSTTVSTWDARQKEFIWSASTFFQDGHYLDDPARWIRESEAESRAPVKRGGGGHQTPNESDYGKGW